MRPAHTPQPALRDATRTIRYEDWKILIHTATDLDQLLALVRAYLAQWRPEQLAILPLEVGYGQLRSSDEIAYRAVIAAQAELKAAADAPGVELLREMSLTLMAAAGRLRSLTAIRGGRPQR